MLPGIVQALSLRSRQALERFKSLPRTRSGVPIKTLPNLRDLLDGKVVVSQIRSLSVEDLLERKPVGPGSSPGPSGI